jgi:hypothetical protein
MKSGHGFQIRLSLTCFIHSMVHCLIPGLRGKRGRLSDLSQATQCRCSELRTAAIGCVNVSQDFVRRGIGWLVMAHTVCCTHERHML